MDQEPQTTRGDLLFCGAIVLVAIGAMVWAISQDRAARAKALADCTEQGGIYMETGRRAECSFVPKKKP